MAVMVVEVSSRLMAPASNDVRSVAARCSSGIFIMGIFRSSAETTVMPHERAETKEIDRNNMVMMMFTEYYLMRMRLIARICRLSLSFC